MRGTLPCFHLDQCCGPLQQLLPSQHCTQSQRVSGTPKIKVRIHPKMYTSTLVLHSAITYRQAYWLVQGNQMSQWQRQICHSPSQTISLPSSPLLWLNALRGRVNQNSIKHQNQGFYGAGAQRSSHPMCWCICTAQHKFYKEIPSFASQLFTLTTKLLPILTAVQSIPLNSIATHQWIKGFLGHPQEAIFLLIM